jgi:DNA replication protein DnaC
MHTDSIVGLLMSQIPLLIMTVNNGTDITNLLPILIVPVIIYIMSLLPKVMEFIKTNKIPSKYVKYHLDDGTKMRNRDFDVNFINNLSVFLNDFNSESIKTGLITNYDRIMNDPNLRYRCVRAIVSPNSDYFCKFIFDQKVIKKIKESGYVFQPNINLKKLQENPIYISFEKFSEIIEKSDKENQNEKIEKERVKISAIDMKAAKDFIYIVNNYNMFKENDIINFKLFKNLYMSCEKTGYTLIRSTVNIRKNYQNVFLTEKNHRTIINIINEWDKNKIAQLNQGIPNKIAFFLTGSPGSGKTSLIYAIANETKRNIASINMQDFTNKAFLCLMSNVENQVVVFDDIDSYKFVQKRNSINDDNSEEIDNFKMIMASPSSDKKDLLLSKFKKEMTLDIFLEVLDGYNYLNGCIVIFTSNHPELLDPAVTRPGRMDHNINFGLCDEYQFRNIFKYFLGKNYLDINNNFVFRENYYSTSYLINTIILPNKHNPKKILQLLE